MKEISAALDAAAVERDALRTQQAGFYAHAAALSALGEHQAEMLHVAGCSLDPPPAEAVVVQLPAATQPGLLAAVLGQAQRLVARGREVFSKAYCEGILKGYIILNEEHMRGYLLHFADGDAISRFANECAACTRLLEQHEAGAYSLEGNLLQLRKYRVGCGGAALGECLLPGLGVARSQPGANLVALSQGTMARALVKYRPDLLPVVLANLTPAPDPAVAGGELAKEEALHTRLHPSLHFVVRLAGCQGRAPSTAPPSLALPLAARQHNTASLRRPLLAQADLGWTEEQRSALRPHWQLYKARVAATRHEALQNLASVQRDASAALSAWDSRPAQSASHAMAAYASLADSTGAMDSWTRLEMVALVELGCAVLEVRAPRAAAGQRTRTPPRPSLPSCSSHLSRRLPAGAVDYPPRGPEDGRLLPALQPRPGADLRLAP